MILKRHLKILLTSIYFFSFSALQATTCDISYYDECETAHSLCTQTIACADTCYRFAIQGKALYLRPSSSNLNYAVEVVQFPLTSPSWKIKTIRPDFQWGFEVEIAGIHPDKSSDIVLSWEHLKSKDSTCKHVASSNRIGPFFEVGPSADLYKKARGKVFFDFDAINLNYGSFLQIGTDWQANVCFGISGAHIRQKLTSKFSNFSETIVRSIKIPSSFIGGGPQLGVNGFYQFNRYLHLTGEMVASLLVGRVKNHTYYKAQTPNLVELDISSPNKQSTSVRHSTQVVPAFKGKLGISSSYAFNSGAELNFETGYQVQIYLNAIQNVDIGSELTAPAVEVNEIGVFARTFHKSVHDFSLSGPYAMLNLTF